MKSFESGFIESQPITQNLLRTVRLLGEYKGKEELFKQQIPQALETLRQAAIIQSTESSNRLEGITAPLQRIRALMAQKATPRNRSEQEIAGYRDVLNTIHAHHAHMPFTTGVALQLHRDLYRYWRQKVGIGNRWITKLQRLDQTEPRSPASTPWLHSLRLTTWRNSIPGLMHCGGRRR